MRIGVLPLVFAFAVLCASVARAAPTHIPTWAFDENNGQGAYASSDQVRRLLSFAEGGLGNDKALHDCSGGGCTSVFYFNPNFVYDSQACPYAAYREFLARANESWFVHESGYSDETHRVHGVYTQSCRGMQVPVNVYVANHSNPQVAAFFRDYLQRHANDWNAYEMDDLSDSIFTQFYGPGGGFCATASNRWCRSTAEMPSDSDLVAAQRSFAASLVHANGSPMAFYYNGIAFTPHNPPVPPLLGPQSPYRGAICENCIVGGGILRTAMYAKVLDAMARIDALPGASFIELNTGSSPAGSPEQIAQRLVTVAVAWLGFAEGHTIVWPDLESNTHDLAVWPEDSLYPTEPLETMRNSVSDLAVAPGLWRREFARCYRDGSPIGPCAAVVNSTTRPVTVSSAMFRQRYDHEIVPSGGDTIMGGVLAQKPFSQSLTLAPGNAALLSR